jgi:hypothetical protein
LGIPGEAEYANARQQKKCKSRCFTVHEFHAGSFPSKRTGLWFQMDDLQESVGNMPRFYIAPSL